MENERGERNDATHTDWIGRIMDIGRRLCTLTGLVASWILVVGCGVAAAQTSETIRLTNGEWQPNLSKDTPHYGFASHIVTEAFALVGVEVEYGFFPWKRSYKIAKEGTWGGTAGLGRFRRTPRGFLLFGRGRPIEVGVLPSEGFRFRLG